MECQISIGHYSVSVSPFLFRNPCSVESSPDYESLTILNSGGSTTNFQPSSTPTASELHSYLLNPQLGEESFGALASGENFSETFDDGLTPDI